MSENNITQSHSTSISDAPGQRQLPRRVRLMGYVVGILLAVGIAALAFWIATAVRGNSTAADAANAPTEAPTPIAPLALQRPLVTEDGLAEQSGVRLLYVAVTGGGGLIDLRFQVIDPDKAVVVHSNPDFPPTIVEATTGLVVNKLFMGHSKMGNFRAGQTYYMIFENPGNLVQSGDKVSVLLGNAEVDNVIVK